MNDEPNIHSGHRQRLLSIVKEAGLCSLSEIQVLEFVLTFTIPRKDTNPIAHKLLDTFGSFSGVCDASVNELVKIKNIGLATAKMLAFIPSILDYYNQNKLFTVKKGTLKTLKDEVVFLKSLYHKLFSEELCVILITQTGQVVKYKIFNTNYKDKVSVARDEIYNFILSTNLRNVIISHSHPDESATPSPQDLSSHNIIVREFEMLNIKLIDNVILGKDDVYSFRAGKAVTYKSLNL